MAWEGEPIKKSDFRSLFSGLVPLFVLAHFGHHLMTALLVPLLPMIRSEFGLGYAQAGLVVSVFSLSYGISQLPAGWLADRISPRLLIAIGICGVALAGLLVGLSKTYVMMLVFLALMGVLGGGYHPASPPLISAAVELKNRGRALGFHIIGGGASYFLAPLLAAAISVVWGWRGSYVILAVPALIFGAVFYVLLGRIARRKAEQRLITPSGQTDVSPGYLRRLVPFMIMSMFAAAVIISAVSFIPLYLVDYFGVDKGVAAALLSLVYSAGLWSGLLGGFLSDRLGRVSVTLVACLIAGPTIFLLNLVPYGPGFGVMLVAIGMVLYIRMPVSEAYIVDQTPVRSRSTVLGIFYFGALEGGGMLTPVIGYLIDHFGFYFAFTVAGAALVVVTLVCSLWLWGNRD